MRIYLSHSIRGVKGKDATKEDMDKNCERIKLLVHQLRILYPSIDFYLPAEHEDFVGKAYAKKFVTEKQILEIDCMIIDECDAVIIYTPIDDNILQGGRLVEFNHCIDTNKPVFQFENILIAVKQIIEAEEQTEKE